MSFPHLGDPVSVWVNDHRNVPMKVEGTLVAIRPRARTAVILTAHDRRIEVPMQPIIDKYGE